MALAGVTDQIVYLEEGDVVDIQLGKYWVVDRDHKAVSRAVKTVHAHSGAAELGPYRHYMQKEIFEQPRAIADTLEGVEGITPELFGDGAYSTFKAIDNVLILACGTSYYSGCVAKYWIEAIAKVPCQVEIASEYRYRESVPNPNTLIVTITQSGETADTLAALRHAQSLGMTHTLTICNVSTSAMVRECKHAYVTRGGSRDRGGLHQSFHHPIGWLVLADAWRWRRPKGVSATKKKPGTSKPCATCPPRCKPCWRWSRKSSLGRKNSPAKKTPCSWAAARTTPSRWKAHSNSKKSPTSTQKPTRRVSSNMARLALVTSAMPVVTVAPNDQLLEKLKSNMQEVRARGGVLYVLADGDTKIESSEGVNVIRMPEHYGVLSPILHVVPLQLLSYHTACARGTDVDKPRNLAKSVTVE